MKKFFWLSAVWVCCAPAHAQFGSPAAKADASMDQLFKSTPVFTATESTAITSGSAPINVTSQMSFDHGSSRSEMNMADVHGGNLPPNALAQMKAIGLDKVINISPANKTNVYTIYPNIRSYICTQVPDSAAITGSNSVQITKVGTETVNGHPCIKNSVVVTSNGESHPFTTWNATDLNNFPIQICVTDQEASVTMTFRNISFAAVPASQFQPPAGFSKYDNLQALMQAAIMSHMSAAPAPPAAPNQ